MRVVFIGCVEFSAALLGPLLRNPDCEVAGVVTRRRSDFNADFFSLEGMAAEAGVPCFPAEGNDQEAMAAWIAARRPDVLYCFGWSYLLKPPILGLARLGVVGYHPAALPQNRGRHPIIWALALGLPETASTFFFMDEGADTGDIVSQERVAIAPEDDAGTLYAKLARVAAAQAAAFTRSLRDGTHRRTKQDPAAGNVWRKRGKADGLIDWRMSADSVRNLVRALARPYPGAHCLASGSEVKVWKARTVAGTPRNLEPGKVLSSGAEGLLVQCGEGAVLLQEHGFSILPPVGSYL